MTERECLPVQFAFRFLQSGLITDFVTQDWLVSSPTFPVSQLYSLQIFPFLP